LKTYWMVMARLPYHIDADEFVKRCSLSGTEELMPWLLPQENAPDELPKAKLIITSEDFGVDCFDWDGVALVSEKMRNAMALGPSVVRYLDVDSSQSAPLARSKRYQIMRVVATDDISDREKSVYETSTAPDGDREGRRPITVVFRDVEPAHELFHDLFFRLVYCTDEFAGRLFRTKFFRSV
jgi:hypothetical protein